MEYSEIPPSNILKTLQMIAATNPSKVGNFGRESLTPRERIQGEFATDTPIHSCYYFSQ